MVESIPRQERVVTEPTSMGMLAKERETVRM